MSRITTTPNHVANAAAQRRERQRRRIARDLLALRTMRNTVNRGQIVCAVLLIPILAILWFAALFKLHWVTGSPVLAVLLSLGLAALMWAIGRRWLLLAWMIVVALLIVVFEDAPADFLSFEDDRKARRRAKLAHAIERREARLRALNDGAP